MAKDLDVEAKLQVKALEDAAFERGKVEGVKAEGDRLAAIHATAIGDAKTEAAKAERERIQAVEWQSLPGHEALIAELKFDGKTTGAEAALRILAAEKTKRERVLANLKRDAPPAVPDAAAPEAPAVADANLPVEERAKKVWDRDPEVRAEFSGKFGNFLAYMRAEASGRVKIFTKLQQ